ncbi:alpha/beta fold hydrolase [Methylobacterium sp. NEAU 140]|uniref:alpha/beta hydrolase n=1 Tax=Methylobacterium sp. NEAU 140 TaxID=3064945 RepID=UPI0027333DEF|nr:alpha/beta fold hydrolase [Methylobacterium sp. NEAU 140]MDP4023660.1 alpha/beta fold hydrolase [Methylobacterium sp. NEAU 140]
MDLELEILTRRPAGTPRGPRLLFVHGICVGAWVWEHHWLPRMAEAGYAAHAVSLRGHGGSPGRADLPRHTLADYTRDLATAAARIGGPLVVVGHSLGGAVVQNWIRGGGRPLGMGLIAAVPPWGLAPSTWRMALTAPALLGEILKTSFGGRPDPRVLRRGLFSEDAAHDALAAFERRASAESGRVGAELQGWPPFAPLPWQAPATFVLGGADDRFVPADEVFRTGLYYGAAPVILPRMAHAVMLEPRWRAAADALLGWLDRLPAR